MEPASSWPRASANDRPDVLTAQHSRQAAGHVTVDDLHTLDMSGVGHHIKQREFLRQRPLLLQKVGGADVADELGLLAARSMGWAMPATARAAARWIARWHAMVGCST